MHNSVTLGHTESQSTGRQTTIATEVVITRLLPFLCTRLHVFASAVAEVRLARFIQLLACIGMRGFVGALHVGTFVPSDAQPRERILNALNPLRLVAFGIG